MFETLLQLSGWSIDDESDTLLADEEAWERAIHRDKRAKQFKNKPFKHRKALTEIFEGTAATGAYARAGAVQTQGDQDDDQQQDDQLGSVIDEVPRFDSQFDASQLNEGQDDDDEDLTTPSQLATTSAPMNSSFSTPQPPSQLKRKQGTERVNSKPNKRSRNQTSDAIREFAAALKEKTYNVPGGAAHATAVREFKEEFDYLPKHDFFKVLRLFNDSQNVITFNALGQCERRTEWVQFLVDEE